MNDKPVYFSEYETIKYCIMCGKKIIKGEESLARYLAKKFCSRRCHWDNKENWDTHTFGKSPIEKMKSSK